MQPLLTSVTTGLLLLPLLTLGVRAADAERRANPALTAVQAADDARLAAMKSGDRGKLEAIFSSGLHYAHSSGDVDTRASFVEKLSSGKTKYLRMDYEKREFSFPAENIALMTGRVHIRTASRESTMDNVLSFLAVWRLENGQWRFLAWQSCRLPPKT